MSRGESVETRASSRDGGQDPDLEPARRVFEAYPDVRAVYLFGSVARGEQGPLSDLDLAVVGDDESVREHRLDMLTDLTRAGYDRVDLVFIDGSDLVLRHEAVRLNRILHARPDFDRAAYYARAVLTYLDFLPYLERQREATKRRILDGPSRRAPEEAG